MISSFAAAMVLAGLLVVGTISPASAQTPFAVENFHPSDDGDADDYGSDAEVLSDRFDGTNTTAHLTAVATTDTDRVQWYVCPDAAAVGTTIDTQAELDACGTPIGTDTTATTPAGGAAGAPVDEAYDIEWNIPVDLDGTLVEIATLACTGAATTGTRVDTQGGLAANCISDVEQDVSLEDAQNFQGPTGADDQTSAGEITGICTSDVDGVAAGDDAAAPNTGDPCEAALYDTGDTSASVAARFRPFPHGSPIPNGGFVFRATTDPSTTDLGFALFGSSDSAAIDDTDDPGAQSCTLITASAQSSLWECLVSEAYMETAGEEITGQELILQIFDETDASGAGYCDTTDIGLGGAATASDPDGADNVDCVYDAHYVVSNARTATTTTFSWLPQPGDGSPAVNAGCDAGETPDTVEDQPIEDDISGVLCVIDQFGNPLSGSNVTFEATGGGVGAGITACGPGEALAGGPGELHDEHGATTTNDSRFDDCHTTTDADGEAWVTVNNFSTGSSITAVPGTQTVTGCVEREFLASPTGDQTNQPTGHGCANEPANAKATGTVNWLALPDHIHFVVSGTGGDNPCHNGDKFRSATVGQTVDLLVCTQLSSGSGTHVGATTNQPGGGRVTYAIVGAAGGQTQIATRLLNQPSETDAAGRATLQAKCEEEGTDTLSATLRDDTDAVVGAPSTLQVTCVLPGEPTISGSPSNTTTTTSPSNSTPSLTSRSITLEASKARVTFGNEFTLTGGISSTNQACVGAQPVTIRRTVGGQAQQEIIDTLTTNSDGTFSKSYTGDKNAQYIASVDSTATCGAASSTPVPVNVKVKVTLRVSDQKIRRGQRVRLTAIWAPCDDNHANTTVVFFKSSGGGFSKFAKKNGGDNCRAAITVRPRRDTSYQARYAAKDDDHDNGKSRKKSVDVRRRR